MAKRRKKKPERGSRENPVEFDPKKDEAFKNGKKVKNPYTKGGYLKSGLDVRGKSSGRKKYSTAASGEG